MSTTPLNSARPVPRPVDPRTLVRDIATTPEAKGPKASQSTRIIGDIFSVAPLAKLDPALNPAVSHAAELAALQSSQNLWSGGSKLSATGNPWLVISFGAVSETAAALFDHADGKAYDFALPTQAVELGASRIFSASLRERGSDQAQSRAILVDAHGALQGAECPSPGAAQALFEKVPSLKARLFADAFGPDALSQHAASMRVESIKEGSSSHFEAVVRGPSGEKKTVLLNNFGLNVTQSALLDQGSGRRPNKTSHDINLARLKLDTFDAAA